MKRAINKMPCYNVFITYSNVLCIEFCFEEITDFFTQKSQGDVQRSA